MQCDFSLAKMRNSTTTQLCSHFNLSKQGRACLCSQTTASELMQSLFLAGLWFDATLFLAHALHKRAAVWWVYVVCQEQVADGKTKDAVLELIEHWVREPNEKKRQHLWACTQNIEKSDPRYWAAMSVYWSGGSISAFSGADAQPAPFLYARAVAAAIDSAASQPQHMMQRDVFYKKALACGLEIAGGGNGRLMYRRHI